MISYQQTLDYLYTQLPMFTRVGEAAYKPNLDNTIKLLEAVGNPHLKLKCVHIAGTNGKGSSSNMLAAVLQSAGYKTGLYTSPHLLDFRERIRIDGVMISKAYVVKFVEQYKPIFTQIQPSFFEMTVALCFDYFAKKKIDVAIIETGLGGRLDSTNVITPLLSIITNIGLDHTHLLGNTIEKIAFEKAGIIKKNIPVVIGETDAKTKKVFIAKAKSEQSKIVFADQKIKVLPLSSNNEFLKLQIFNEENCWFKNLKLSLPGQYQIKNVATVLQSLLWLKNDFKITDKHISTALGNVQKLTGFAGRWQLVSKNPRVILDTGHNAHGLKLSMQQLKEIRKGQLHIVFGAVNDKNLDDVMKLLPKDARYYLCAPKLPRALHVEELKKLFIKQKLNFNVYDSVVTAYKSAHKLGKRKDIIFVGGSTFVVAEVMEKIRVRVRARV